MAGTIAPARLLGTLKVLLSPSGGIKSHQEVGRLVSLMQKFSRKLVSKVIYIHILRSSTPKLLEVFLVESGWDLLSSWLSRAVCSTNWPLCSELLYLLTLCPPPPHPTRPAVQDLLLTIQLQNHQSGHLSTLALQITSKWSHPGLIPKSCLQATPSSLSSLSKTVVDSTGSSLQDSPMTLSRRCKRSVIVTNPHVVANTSPPVNGAMLVTFQEKPLQKIVDVFKSQRRGVRLEIETQVWKKHVGSKRKIEKEVCRKVDERKNKSAPMLSMLPPRRRKEPQFEDPSDPVFENCSLEKSDDVKCPMTGFELRPRGLKTPLGTLVSVVNDQAVTQIKNLHNEVVGEDVEEEANPLKIFEEISNELKENLLFEKHIALNQVSKRTGGNVWGLNNNENVTGFEGSAKDYRLARREKFREEQKLLEEQNEAKERKAREVKRERMKKVKREDDRRAKMVKEVDDKKRKIEIEVEEKKKREKMEADFKKRREEERLRRKEKERQERNLGSLKSELKNGLNSDEKSRIKLIAQQMKQSSDASDSSSSTVLGRIPKLGKIIESGQIESAPVSKPAKPLFSVAKNKNKDLLASLEAPLKPLKRSMVAIRDPLLKKFIPLVLSRKLPAEPRQNYVDYGIPSLALGSTSQSLKNKEESTEEVSSQIAAKGGSDEVKVDAPNGLPQQDDPKPEESDEDQLVRITSATPTKLQGIMSNDKNEVKSKSNETSHRDHTKDVKNKSSEKNTEHKKIHDNKKSESNRSHEDMKPEAKRSREDKTLEDKRSQEKKPEAKKSHDDKNTEPKKSHDIKSTRAKPPLTLKPVSQLKESSLFGSLLENVEKTSWKKRKSSSLGGDHNKNSKYSKTEKAKMKDAPAVSKAPGNVVQSSPPKDPVANVPRKVCGILIVDRGSVETKRTVKWRGDEDLVQVEYFEVDASERVNVHKLKFEEVRQQERVKERSLLSTRHNPIEKEGDENPWKGLKILDNCGRGNFKAGNKSGERELQRMREERVLPNVCFGNLPMNPSEPDVSMNRNILGVVATRDILADDISGEGTEVDYSADGWPEPSGIMAGCEEGIGAGQFYGGCDAARGQVDAGHGHDQEHGRLPGGGIGQRFSSSHPHSRGFGRGAAAASWAMRGFRGGFDTRGRGVFGGKRNVPCKYWRRGTCRDGQDCKFMHI